MTSTADRAAKRELGQLNTVLVANRGEIAVRIIKAVQQQGWTAIAIYSDADRGSLHTQLADRAIALGGNSPTDTYLDIAKVLAAARNSGAEAIHPGYGFLSENADFAEACGAAGFTFIGPMPKTIRLMGDKRAAKQAVTEVGVPCIAGYDGADQSELRLITEGETIGVPLMVKAAAGGGGRGMRLVTQLEELPAAIAAARLEAKNAFGDSNLLLERALINSRHIEIQIAGDAFGNLIHLGERDCSLQRKHQKVIEEAPSPFVSDELRAELGQAAIRAAQSCEYLGVGTVEFLVAADGSFAFLEMNTRLQVEHPVTEMVTGIDLVALQLQIAAGQPLGIEQHQVQLHGHAIEVRLYAEDPANNFAPQTGSVVRWQPATGQGTRIDHGLLAQDQISPHYDAMIAKIIVLGASRSMAISRVQRAVQDTQILGIKTNQHFLTQLLADEIFVQGQATTDYIDHRLTIAPPPNALLTEDLALAIVALLNEQDPQPDELRYWSNAQAMPRRRRLLIDSTPYQVTIAATPQSVSLSLADMTATGAPLATHTVIEPRHQDGKICATVGGVDHAYAYCYRAGPNPTLFLHSRSGQIELIDLTYEPPLSRNAQTDGQICASTEGKVVGLAVDVGQMVAEGELLVVVEAMKMEHRHTAPHAGVVADVPATLDAQVKKGELLLALQPARETNSDEGQH